MCTMQQMFPHLEQLKERQDLTKYSLHLEAEDAVDLLKHSNCHKCEGSALFSGGTWRADTISKDVESVQDNGNTTQYLGETVTQMW